MVIGTNAFQVKIENGRISERNVGAFHQFFILNRATRLFILSPPIKSLIFGVAVSLAHISGTLTLSRQKTRMLLVVHYSFPYIHCRGGCSNIFMDKI